MIKSKFNVYNCNNNNAIFTNDKETIVNKTTRSHFRKAEVLWLLLKQNPAPAIKTNNPSQLRFSAGFEGTAVRAGMRVDCVLDPPVRLHPKSALYCIHSPTHIYSYSSWTICILPKILFNMGICHMVYLFPCIFRKVCQQYQKLSKVKICSCVMYVSVCVCVCVVSMESVPFCPASVIPQLQFYFCCHSYGKCYLQRFLLSTLS